MNLYIFYKNKYLLKKCIIYQKKSAKMYKISRETNNINCQILARNYYEKSRIYYKLFKK